jgi:DNA-binding response OmpR family regulator
VRKKILVVEDDQGLARVLRDNLTYLDFDVQCVGDGQEALHVLHSWGGDLVLLDVMLPNANGFELCRVLRQSGRMPIIMLTARDQKVDKVRGFEAGADDYVTKPFDFDELQARIRAVLRRARLVVERIKLGAVVVDFQNLRASHGLRQISLTRREFDLLAYLAERRGLAVHRSELLREVWRYPIEPATRAVDDAIKRLRRKLEADPHRPVYLTTVHGDGYCLTFSD